MSTLPKRRCVRCVEMGLVHDSTRTRRAWQNNDNNDVNTIDTNTNYTLHNEKQTQPEHAEHIEVIVQHGGFAGMFKGIRSMGHKQLKNSKRTTTSLAVRFLYHKTKNRAKRRTASAGVTAFGDLERNRNQNQPKRIPPWQIMTVKSRARVGSPRFEDTANGARNGMTSSLAMACSRRGAPVRLCSPAPSVDRNEPIRITHSLGHAMLATTSLPPMEAPNLRADGGGEYERDRVHCTSCSLMFA